MECKIAVPSITIAYVDKLCITLPRQTDGGVKNVVSHRDCGVPTSAYSNYIYYLTWREDRGQKHLIVNFTDFFSSWWTRTGKRCFKISSIMRKLFSPAKETIRFLSHSNFCILVAFGVLGRLICEKFYKVLEAYFLRLCVSRM